ncbi:polyhydroxyalkanoate depolymerase [Curvibacter sp. HBC61]|uniref:Polyhydroxyalkanoate depolymerase n=1 Tax=Curvibacter cyanobacteriorum TaxID=3026422 RepID=A0ABT5MXW3_9BURK|nr:polyhydroxyalkanoate depolymerase [Curvibacter sp. HBC61]MDD0838131.1 polyhydroxyalkanoate depolymerase [Curvibacter sp. HBC61]
MLYQVYETQRSLMEPFSDFAQAAAKMLNNPVFPLSQVPFAQRLSAGYDLMYRLGKDYEKPVFGINTVDVDGVGVAIHERIEIDKPFCELRRFKRFSDDPATLTKLKGQPVVLIVAPLSGHYATLLRDTVRTMLKDHKVYITDWKNARLVPLADGEFHLDDYVNYVQDFIRHLQGAYGNCHVISVCQPTVPVLAAVSLMASRGETTPLSMTMMGGPIDASKSPTAVNNLATNKSYEWFENNVIYRVPHNFPGAGRRVYPGFLQHTGFVAMNPDRHATSHYDYFKDLIKGDDASVEAHRKFYDEYNAVLDMDADYYLETIKTVFQDFKLVNGTWDVRSPEGKIERVRPQDIVTTALLTVEGELDDISGSGQTAAAHDLCASIPSDQHKHLEAKGAGHYGIFSGRRWREIVYPVVKRFILERQAPAKAPVVNSAPQAPSAPAAAAAPVIAPTAPAVAAAVAPAEPATPATPTVATPRSAASRKQGQTARSSSQPAASARRSSRGGSPKKG